METSLITLPMRWLGILGANACHYEVLNGTTSAAHFLQDDLEAGCFEQVGQTNTYAHSGTQGFLGRPGRSGGRMESCTGKGGDRISKQVTPSFGRDNFLGGWGNHTPGTVDESHRETSRRGGRHQTYLVRVSARQECPHQPDPPRARSVKV